MTSPLLRKANLLDDETDLELITINKILIKKYGLDYVNWESETLKEAVIDDFQSLGDMSWQKMQAGRLLLKNSAAWEEWEVFENVCCAVLGEPAIFSQTQPPEPEDMAITLETLKLVARHKFHKDVLGYIAAACIFDGLWSLPDPLFIAQDVIKDHDRFNGINRDFVSPKLAAKGRSKVYVRPGNMAEAQANRMISVTTAVTEFKQKLAKENQQMMKLELL